LKLRLWLLLSLLASATSCLYMFRVLLPWEHYVDVERGKLRAQMGDLYPRWVGTRELLLHGRNPYSPEVSHEIQIAFYGHEIDQEYGQPGMEIIDEQRFVYPVYVVFLLAPMVYLSFSQAQMCALVLFTLLTGISVVLWLDLVRWRPPKILVAAITLFVLSSPQIMQGLRLGQFGLVVAFLLTLSAWCLARNHLAWAGVFLAVATIKPQMAVLPLAWFFLWGVSAWPRRWALLAGFGVTLATLVALGELILPGWPSYFLDGLIAYRKYFPTTSLLCLALGNWAGGAVSGIAIIALLALAWRKRKVDAASPDFIQTLAAFFVAASLVLPLFQPFNQVLLLLPALMVVRDWDALPRLARRCFFVVVAWPWIASFVLLLLPPRLDSTNRLPLLPSALVLFVPFLLLPLLLTKSSRTGAPPSSPIPTPVPSP
jgi:Glycosyltransferase family 87